MTKPPPPAPSPTAGDELQLLQPTVNIDADISIFLSNICLPPPSAQAKKIWPHRQHLRMPHAVEAHHVTYGPNSYLDGSAARGSRNDIRCKKAVAVTVTE